MFSGCKLCFAFVGGFGLMTFVWCLGCGVGQLCGLGCGAGGNCLWC